MDYKERFISLLNEMYADQMLGLIPSMIAEGLKECDFEFDYWMKRAVILALNTTHHK